MEDDIGVEVTRSLDLVHQLSSDEQRVYLPLFSRTLCDHETAIRLDLGDGKAGFHYVLRETVIPRPALDYVTRGQRTG